MKKNWQVRQHWFELRFACSWTWLMPLILIICMFWLAKSTYDSEQTRLKSGDLYGVGGQKIQHAQQVSGPKYATTLRGGLEICMPLLGVFMTAGLIAQEWQQGTIAQIVLRKRLWFTFFERLAYVVLYITAVVIVATSISYQLTVAMPSDSSLLRWVWETLVIVMPTTLAVMAIGLLVAHLLMSVRGSYIVIGSWWMGNLVYILFVVQGQASKTNNVFYTWFGWLYREIALKQELWWSSKAIWMSIGCVLFIVQVWLLRSEARYMHNIGE